MATPILMPRQGNTVEECLLAAWRKKKGDTVAAGEILADIETDKATFELESPASGVILELFVEPGTLVPVMTNIGAIGEAGESVESLRPVATAEAAPSAAAPAAVATASTSPETSVPAASAVQPVSGATSVSQPQGELTPRAVVYLERHPISPLPKRGSGINGSITEDDLIALFHQRSRLSPTAAALVKKGFRVPAEGSGAAGLILANDLLPAGKKLTAIRAIIASRMKESLNSSAQYTVSMKAPAAGLLALRKKVKPLATAGKLPDISINDFVNFAVIKTVVDFPELNAELIDGVLYSYKEVHLAFACDTPRGLLVPVIKNGHKMSLAELTQKSRGLAQAAQEGRIAPDDLSGGTFTVSNLGSFGVTEFTPVINVPQTGILGICGICLEPVRAKDGTVVFEDKIGLSLTSDHQVVDGAVAARFLKKLSENLANIEALSGL